MIVDSILKKPTFVFLLSVICFSYPGLVLAQCDIPSWQPQNTPISEEVVRLVADFQKVERQSQERRIRFSQTEFPESVWFIARIGNNPAPILKQRTIKPGVSNVVAVALPREALELIEAKKVAVFENPLYRGPRDDGLWLHVRFAPMQSGWIMASPGLYGCEGSFAVIEKTSSRLMWEANQEAQRADYDLSLDTDILRIML